MSFSIKNELKLFILVLLYSISHAASAKVSVLLENVLHTQGLLKAGYRGQGVRVGVISNGAYNYTSLVRQGFLPDGVAILNQGHGMDDEGDWMMQVVHQIAPAAKLAFCAGTKPKRVITCARDLLSRFHADIIVDDTNPQPIFYFPTLKETGFSELAQDNPNALFFTGAGNNNGGYYQARWKPIPQRLNGHKYMAQDFGGSLGFGKKPYNSFLLRPGGGANVLLGTNANPNGGPSDCDSGNPQMVLMLTDNHNVVVKTVEGNCPILRMHYKNTRAVPVKLRISVLLENNLQLNKLKLKLVVTRRGEGVSPIVLQYHTLGSAGNSATAPELNAVAAVDPNSGWHNHYLHELFANSGPQCQDFIQSGLNRWTRLSQERCYKQPRFVTPDRTVVMMDGPSGERLKPFIGDSAAGPAAAGAAALLISAHVPARTIIRLFKRTAIPQADTSGWDKQYGYGLINADAAAVMAGVLPAASKHDIKAENNQIQAFRPDTIFKHYRKLSLMALHGDMRAFHVLQKTANSGELDAQTWLGIYEHFAGNNKQAANWLLKAADRGAAFAQFYLGTLYNRGWGLPLDPRAAQAWWLRAAHAGVAKAMFNMGITNLHARGALPDPTLAAALMRAAELRGLRNPKIFKALAMLHAKLTIRQLHASEKMARHFAANPLSIPAVT